MLPVTAFISSTSIDLADYRQAAIEVCNELQLTPIAMEFFGAAGVGATAGSKSKLESADVYLGIFAHRYGYIEEGYEKSVTEIEFDYADERGLERLCFIVDPHHPWPPDAWDYKNKEKLDRLKARIEKLIRAKFTTADDFKVKLYRTLVQWRDRTHPPVVMPDTESRGTRPPPVTVPAPSLIVGRERDLALFRTRLGAEDGCSQRKPLTIVRGWPGVGKTTFVSAIAHDPAVIRGFPDGILWASAGETPDPVKELKLWGRYLGCDLQSEQALEDVMSRLRVLLRDKQTLLIVDDVWEAESASPFRVGGPGCALIVTTRFIGVSRDLAVTDDDVYVLERLIKAESLDVLRQLAPTVSAGYPEECANLVDDLEGLPLALRVAGRLLEHEARSGFDVRESFHSLASGATLLAQKAPEDRFDPKTGTTPTIQLLLKQSTDRLDEESRRCFTCLGAFAPKPATFDLEAIKDVTDIGDVKRVVLKLVDRGLLEPIPSTGRFWMHAVLVLHAASLLNAF
ncbi:MAG: DUF4062 domain-containing protein [Verrucomicrobia bacterium]|nr:DUF4062 domain-containing protein [Verrucomicrobiota bacterium]